MTAVMGVSIVLFCCALAALVAARRRLGRALEAERLDAHLARELAHFDRRAQKARAGGGGPGDDPRAGARTEG